MNRAKRKELDRAATLIGEAKDIIESVASDEEDSFENLPEGIQDSERGEAFCEAFEVLAEHAESLGDIQEEIGSL